MIYKFLDNQGTFSIDNPHRYNFYFPLTNQDGSILSAIAPNLSGDIKIDNDHFITPPASIEDLRSNFLCRRDFFLKTGKEIIRLSEPCGSDTLTAGFLYHTITKKTKTLNIEITNFVPYDLPIEIMRISILAKTSSELTATSFIPLYGRAEKNLRDHRHVSSLLNKIRLQACGLYLQPTMIFNEKNSKLNEQIYYALGFDCAGNTPTGQFPTLDSFYGKGGILKPDAIYSNLKPAIRHSPEFDGKEVCAGLRFKSRKLKKNQTAEFFIIIGTAKNEKDISEIFSKINTSEKIAKALEETKKYWQCYLSQISFDFGNKNYNNWLMWVKLQPTLRKLFGCSFLPHFDYGKGGRGWRDLWQDALTLLVTEPQKAEEIIFNSFNGVRIDGSNATIINKNGAFSSDRNNVSRVWMDHGVWPYLTTRLYLHRSGNLDILTREAGYFKDHQLKRAKKIDINFQGKDYILRTTHGQIYQGSILEHLLIQNLTAFFNVGQHNTIRLENADWNDGLDLAAEQGESAAFSFMYAHNLRDLADLLQYLKEKTQTVTLLNEVTMLLDRINSSPYSPRGGQVPLNYDDYQAKQKLLDEYLEKTKTIRGEKVEIKIDDIIRDLNEKADHLFNRLNKHQWLTENFFNGYYDNTAKPVEGNGRIMLQSQVFALLSKGVSPVQMKKLWQSLNKHLYDKHLGGFRLNTNFGAPYLSFGRAFGFVYGDKENGAFFSHMNVMLAFALYQSGMVQEGDIVLSSIYQMTVNNRCAIPPVLPEYINNQGQGLYLYLTGSASWYIHTLLSQVLGIQYNLGVLTIQPNLTAENFVKNIITCKIIAYSKPLTLIYIREKEKSNVLTITKAILAGKNIAVENNVCVLTQSMLSENTVVEIYLK